VVGFFRTLWNFIKSIPSRFSSLFGSVNYALDSGIQSAEQASASLEKEKALAENESAKLPEQVEPGDSAEQASAILEEEEALPEHANVQLVKQVRPGDRVEEAFVKEFDEEIEKGAGKP
jgi:hypothetical protein